MGQDLYQPQLRQIASWDQHSAMLTFRSGKAPGMFSTEWRYRRIACLWEWRSSSIPTEATPGSAPQKAGPVVLWPDAQKTMADIHCRGPLAKTALWYAESTMFLCNKPNIYIYIIYIYIYINYIQLYYNVTLSTTRCYFPIALVDFHILSQRFPRTSHLFCFPRGWRHGPVARKTPCSASEILLLGVSRTPSRCSGANFLRQTQQCKLVNLSICWKQWKTILVYLSIY